MIAKKSLNFLACLVSCSVFGLSVPFSALGADGISVKGSTTIGPVFKEMVGKFARENKIPVNVQGGGSGEGLKCALDKTCDIGLASKSVSGAAAEGLNVIHLGWDGLAFVVNIDNPVSAITSSQIKDIFSGKIKNWKELGGKEANILAYTREKDRGEFDFFKSQFKEEPKGTDELGATDAVVVKVSKVTDSISFMSFGIAEKNLSRGLKILSVDGVAATKTNLESGSYPLRRELNAVTSKSASKPEIQKLLNFVLQVKESYFETYGFVAK